MYCFFDHFIQLHKRDETTSAGQVAGILRERSEIFDALCKGFDLRVQLCVFFQFCIRYEPKVRVLAILKATYETACVSFNMLIALLLCSKAYSAPQTYAMCTQEEPGSIEQA